MTYKNLCPEKALIWRIVHRHNLPWILENGLHCGNSDKHCADWVNIGNAGLIDKRARRNVPIASGGVLNDYVPFYFTPFSPMMYNIHTGRGGVRQVANVDIVLLVSSLHVIAEMGLKFVFTDRHAYPVTAKYFSDLDDLRFIDWSILQRRDFQRDPDDPGKTERYQAEALIHRHVPVQALLGIICCNREVQQEVQRLAERMQLAVKAHCRSEWYF